MSNTKGTSAIVPPSGGGAQSGMGEKFSPQIIIGNNVSIQKDCHIGAINRIVLGNNVLLASKVFITDHSHGKATKEDIFFHPSQRKLFTKGPVIIEDNVGLGALCTIDKGVSGDTTIGAGTKIDNQVHVGHDTIIGKDV